MTWPTSGSRETRASTRRPSRRPSPCFHLVPSLPWRYHIATGAWKPALGRRSRQIPGAPRASRAIVPVGCDREDRECEAVLWSPAFRWEACHELSCHCFRLRQPSRAPCRRHVRSRASRGARLRPGCELRHRRMPRLDRTGYAAGRGLRRHAQVHVRARLGLPRGNGDRRRRPGRDDWDRRQRLSGRVRGTTRSAWSSRSTSSR